MLRIFFIFIYLIISNRLVEKMTQILKYAFFNRDELVKSQNVPYPTL